MAATPTSWHQEVVDALKNQMAAVCPPDLKVLREQEIRLDERLRRNPDLLVVHADAYSRRRSRYFAYEVVLAVEVVSPGSETDDRRESPHSTPRVGSSTIGGWRSSR
ncbi:hypothetical protein GCM10023263_05860 [Phytohabitans rumicis]